MNDRFDFADLLFTAVINRLVLWILAISGVFLVLDAVGFMPRRLSDKVNRNRLDQTLRLLQQFGVDVDKHRRAIGVAELENVQGQVLETRVKEKLEKAMINGPVSVGSVVVVSGSKYIDLMGATSDYRIAQSYARDLAALWRRVAGNGGDATSSDIRFIATPKTGSPLLGSAFSEIIKKPLLLHNPQRKFESNPEDARSFFDCQELPAQGSRGLIIDDSSTGGGKALQLILDLQRCGWSVSDMLVVFEPQVKVSTNQHAAERLRSKGVKLHSIVKS